MLSFKRITTRDTAEYQFVEDLFISAFPPEERRELSLQREFTDSNPLFHNHIILDDEKQVGFISYWNFGDFYYVEHFAMSPTVRNGGYGQKSLLLLDELLGKPIVLEVEHPNDEMSRRRIGFYQRLGYELWEREYFQPPYKEGDGFLPMYVMAKGNLTPENDFERVKRSLYEEVYLARS